MTASRALQCAGWPPRCYGVCCLRRRQPDLPKKQAVDPAEVERFTDGDADAGAKLYKRYCSGCHGADGRGGAHTFMPHVQNLTEKDYIELVPDGYLYQGYRRGRRCGRQEQLHAGLGVHAVRAGH